MDMTGNGFDMIRFANPEWANLFWLIPLFIGFFAIYRYLYRLAMRRFGNPDVIYQIADMQSHTRPYVKFVLFLVAFSLVSLAAMNPQVGSRMEEARLEGVDIVIALDVSRSMLAEDVRPNRLERARLAVSRLIEELDQDRVGIVAFAGTAHTRVPLTSDHHAARMILRTLGTESVPVQGTAVGQALARAAMAFVDDSRTSKAIILISDGESHEDDPVEYARMAADRDIVIHTVGVGSREGAPIPMYENDRMTGHVRDGDGRVVITRYDEDAMREIARTTGGVFRHGSGPDLGLDQIMEAIREMEKEAYETSVFADYESRFHYLLALAFILLILELLMMDRKNRYLKRLRLFKT